MKLLSQGPNPPSLEPYVMPSPKINISPPLASISERGSSGQSLPVNKSKTKFSFKVIPQNYNQKNRDISNVSQNSSHIKFVEQNTDKVQKNIHQKTHPRRRKIFDESMMIVKLLDGPVNQLKKQDSNKARSILKPDNVGGVEISNKNIEINKSLNVQAELMKSPIQEINNKNNRSFERQKPQNIRGDDDWYARQKTLKLLNEPILMEMQAASKTMTKQRQTAQSQTKISKQLQYIVNNYSKVVQRIQKNQKDINTLQQQLKNNLLKEAERQRSLLQILNKQNSQMQTNKKIIDFITMKQVNRQREQSIARQKKRQQQLEEEQEMRLQQLIFQNKHLCAKVLQQRHRSQNVQQSQEHRKIQKRIQELRRMRVNQNNSMTSMSDKNLSKLDISAIPMTFYEKKATNGSVKPAIYFQVRGPSTPNQIPTSDNSQRPFTPTLGIPQLRDPPVRMSKIY